jgi:tetratricopeptide (TPR) repeat protein
LIYIPPRWARSFVHDGVYVGLIGVQIEPKWDAGQVVEIAPGIAEKPKDAVSAHDDKPRTPLDEAVSAFNSAEWEQAIDLAQAALDADPSLTEASLLIARSNVALHSYKLGLSIALRTWDQGINHKMSVSDRLIVAKAMESSSRTDEALQMYRNITASTRQSPSTRQSAEAALYVAKHDFAKGEFKEAARLLQVVEKLQVSRRRNSTHAGSADLEVVHGVAMCLKQLGKKDAAIVKFEEALKLANDSHSQAHFHLALLLAKNRDVKNVNRALQHARKAANLEPKNDSMGQLVKRLEAEISKSKSS